MTTKTRRNRNQSRRSPSQILPVRMARERLVEEAQVDFVAVEGMGGDEERGEGVLDPREEVLVLVVVEA